MKRSFSSSERGSVMIYIMLAIGLLAALSFFITRGGRTNAGFLTAEQAKVGAQEIVEYGGTVADAVQKLRLRGCSDEQISFENDVVSTGYTNGNAPVDKHCHVFDPAGGRIAFQTFNENYHEQYTTNPVTPYLFFTAGSAYVGFGQDCTDDHCRDLAAYTLVTEDICLRINELQGISSIPEDTDQGGGPTFTGIYTGIGTSTLVLDEPADNPLAGKSFGCIYETGDGTPNHIYYQILIAR